MVDRGQRETKRPNDQERMERLKKASKTGNRGKGIAESSTVALPRKVVAPPPAPVTRPSDRPEARSGSSREDRPVVAVPTFRSHREDPRPQDLIPPASRVEPSRWTSSVHEVLVSKFSAKSSWRSNPINAIGYCADKLIEVSSCCCDLPGTLIH